MKWKERVGLSLAVSAVLLTTILVLDIRFAQNRGEDDSALFGSLRHGVHRQKAGGHFRRQFLDRGNESSRPADEFYVRPPAAEPLTPGNIPPPNGEDQAEPSYNEQGSRADAMISDLARKRKDEQQQQAGQQPAGRNGSMTPSSINKNAELQKQLDTKSNQFMDLMAYVSVAELNRPVARPKPRSLLLTVESLLNFSLYEDSPTWEKFHAAINEEELYPEDDTVVDALLDEMAHQEFLNISQKEGGTQLKLVIDFPQEGVAMMKPMRFTREQETLPNHFYFTDFERHNAEIASFHLDRILGFRRAPPVTGRLVNMTTELYALATGELLRTFFISPDQNLCFHGRCSYYCDTSHAVCGKPDQLEASLAAYLPSKRIMPRKTWRNPWRRSYHKRKRQQWEEDDDYCETVRQVPPYSEGRRLPDIIDMSIFDFLTGNMDRHHYETFSLFGNESYPIHMDQGRAFGRAKHDEMSILAPLYQCCLVRRTTLATLMRFHHGPVRLSGLMRKSMARDPLDPILAPGHLDALDRRVAIILRVIRHCLKRFQPDQVLVGLDEWTASNNG